MARSDPNMLVKTAHQEKVAKKSFGNVLAESRFPANPGCSPFWHRTNTQQCMRVSPPDFQPTCLPAYL